jgi:hypothetical protein
MIVAPPASGKGRMNLALELVEPIHKFIKNNSLQLRNECLADKDNKPNDCPKVDLKIVPGNISSSKLYQHLENSNFGILIFESEADTLSSMLKQEWGNFSDILRKAFHHEKISMSRSTDDLILEVNDPQLSLILSGTENQLQPLIKAKENGLFSRFLYYHFNEKSQWKDISELGSEIDFREEFKKLSKTLFNIYGRLVERSSELRVRLTEEQWVKFNEEMRKIHNTISLEGQEYFSSSIKRHGVILVRLLTVLTVLRNFEDISNNDILYVDSIDFEIALSIICTTIFHSLEVYYLLDNDKNDLPVKEFKLLQKLDEKFERQEAIKLASSLEIPKRTADFYLKKWQGKELIVKISNGIYKKL